MPADLRTISSVRHQVSQLGWFSTSIRRLRQRHFPEGRVPAPRSARGDHVPAECRSPSPVQQRRQPTARALASGYLPAAQPDNEKRPSIFTCLCLSALAVHVHIYADITVRIIIHGMTLCYANDKNSLLTRDSIEVIVNMSLSTV